MIRTAFNAGEVSPELSLRTELDVFHRACSLLTNFNLHQMGGVSRRRGFKRLLAAQKNSRLFPYVYSTNDCFLIEIGSELLRVISKGGEVIASFPSSWKESELQSLRVRQCNSLLLIASPSTPLTQLKRNDFGEFSLTPFEFKNLPFRNEEMRDYPVLLRFVDGAWETSFPENMADDQSVVNSGDLMRVKVTVPQQTGFKPSAEIYSGYKIVSDLTTASLASGDKIAINEGAYWSWWTCIQNFEGSSNFISGYTKPSDYPLYFEKGIACHDNTLTCKGTWSFYCYKEWYGTYAVERKFPDSDWELVSTSNSPLGAASNLQLTGNEEQEECYLRLRIYESQLSSDTNPTTGFPATSCGNKLVVDPYTKTAILKLREDGSLPSTVQSFQIEEPLPALLHYLYTNSSRLEASEIEVNGSLLPYASAKLLFNCSDAVDVSPRGILAGSLPEGGEVAFKWQLPNKNKAKVIGFTQSLHTLFLPAEATVYSTQTYSPFASLQKTPDSIGRITSFSKDKGTFKVIKSFSKDSSSYKITEAGFYTLRQGSWDNAGFQVSHSASTASISAIASNIVQPDITETASEEVSFTSLYSFSVKIPAEAQPLFYNLSFPENIEFSIDSIVFDIEDFTHKYEGDEVIFTPKTELLNFPVSKNSILRIKWSQSETNELTRDKGALYYIYVPESTKITSSLDVWWKTDFVLRGSSLVSNSGLKQSDTLSFSTQKGTDDTYSPLWFLQTVEAGSISFDPALPSKEIIFDCEVTSVNVSGKFSRWENISHVPENIPTSCQSSYWSFPAFREAYGFPSVVDVFQSRLVLASTKDQPQTIWMSQSDDINNFEVNKLDTGALNITLQTTSQNPILWLMPQGNRLQVGASDGEWIVSNGSSSVTPNEVSATKYGSVGSSSVRPIHAIDQTLYIERGSGRVYQYAYNFDVDSFVSKDVSIFAPHLFASGICDSAFVQKPEPRALFAKNDGEIAVLSYNPLQEIQAWSRIAMNGKIDSVAVLPNGEASDLIFVATNVGDLRFIDVLDQDNNEFVDPDGEDYDSILITNALATQENLGQREHRDDVIAYFEVPTLAENISVSVDGIEWSKLDRNPSELLPKGWTYLVANGFWEYNAVLGIKVNGNKPCHILSCQS